MFEESSMKDKAEKKDADGDKAMKNGNVISLIDEVSAVVASEVSKEAEDREKSAKTSSGGDTVMFTDEALEKMVDDIMKDITEAVP